MAGFRINRRRFLTAAGIGASMLPLAGCDAFDGLLGGEAEVRKVLARRQRRDLPRAARALRT